MTLAIHVIAHKRTDVVLAAYSRSDVDTPDSLVAVIGDGLPIAYQADTVSVVPSLGTIAADELADEKAPGDANLEVGSVLEAPRDFIVVRDPQGQAQSLQAGPVLTATISGKVLRVNFPIDITLVGVVGWVRLVPAIGTPHDIPVTITPETLTNLKIGVATLAAPNGAYAMLLLAKGFAAAINPAVTVS